MNPFDNKPTHSFNDVINLYNSLKSLGYTDEHIVSICGFLHDALNLYLINSNRESETKSINFNKL